LKIITHLIARITLLDSKEKNRFRKKITNNDDDICDLSENVNSYTHVKFLIFFIFLGYCMVLSKSQTFTLAFIHTHTHTHSQISEKVP